MACELRVLAAELALAVAPESVGETLDSLVSNGLLSGYREEPPEVVVWGNLTALEAALDNFRSQDSAANQQPLHTAEGQHRAQVRHEKSEYLVQARRFATTSTFARLAPTQREIWGLHSRGMTYMEIQLKLRVSAQRVRLALHGARLAAGLPTVTKDLPARGGGRPRLREGCSEPGCPNPHHGVGLCAAHYKRRWQENQEREHSRRLAAAKR